IYHWKSFGSCTDGSSNTVAASEKAGVKAGNEWTVIAGCYDGDITMREGDTNNNPSSMKPHLCLQNAYSTTDKKLLAKRISGFWGGAIWFTAAPSSNSFHTVLAPNAPMCRSDVSVVMVLPPSSYHPGGVNSAFLDGSVHFISDTIDTGDLTKMRVLNGPSPYGVWGAMGTPDGGENSTL
ncbi:MAG: DUF1559 domain-containing protein, partial [Planctomycetaceae bacterium]|nr:DUF1559 domain-containing protein [Planctomycetaceae bacterium]